MQARSLNIGVSGMAIVADGPIAANATLAVQFLLPFGGALQQIVAHVRVVHSVYSSSERGFVIGMTFMSLAPATVQFLTAFAGGG